MIFSNNNFIYLFWCDKSYILDYNY